MSLEQDLGASSSDASDISYELIYSLLADFSHPTLEMDLRQLRALNSCSWGQSGRLRLELRMPFIWNQGFNALKIEQSGPICSATGAVDLEWALYPDVARMKCANHSSGLPHVRNIIAVSSAKGGVGKSFIAVNLALALAAEGGKVGLLDADIYGPSIPLMLGTAGKQPSISASNLLDPIEAHGIFTGSIGYLLEDHQAAAWRGPIASRTLIQLLRETSWPELDYLVVDMPPGTGDLQLTMAQQIPVVAAVVVTTPQKVALSDTMRGISLFNKIGVPLLGIVENMSGHLCPRCGHCESLSFFPDGGQPASVLGLPLLGVLPFSLCLQEDSEHGIPTVVREPEGETALWFRRLAAIVASRLYWQGEPLVPGVRTN